MASLDILCFNPFKLKNKFMKIEHTKIFHGLSKILKNISWPYQYMPKIFHDPYKNPPPPLLPPLSYMLNVWSLSKL